MIREFQTADTEQVMQIWLNGNEDAHPFISKKYWCGVPISLWCRSNCYKQRFLSMKKMG